MGQYGKTGLSLVLKESVRSFYKNNCVVFSASLAFYAMFAAIPILLLAVLALGRVLVSSQDAIGALQRLTSALLPGKQKVIFDEVYSLSLIKGIWSTVGIITCLWSIVPLVSALKIVFSSIFKVESKRPFFYELVLDVSSALMLMLILIFLVIGEITYSQVVTRLIKDISLPLHLADLLTNFVIAGTGMAIFYYVFIPVKLKFRHILAVSYLISLLWEMVRPTLFFFITLNPRFGIAFGSLKALFLLFMWVYVSFFMILFGVEIMANLWRKETVVLRELIIRAHKNAAERRKLLQKYAVSYKAGGVVFEKGSPGNRVYYVVTGCVKLLTGDREPLAACEGDFFGIASMLSGIPEPETAIAVDDDTLVLHIGEKDFSDLITLAPEITVTLLRRLALQLHTPGEPAQVRETAQVKETM
ncbi:MAG: YihY/virulence factor BrkB family protein [Nitrospirae bacterium]|nr:YihY/virulence factor BrkB family protein [Nitrospirota bacterium]